MFRHDQVILMLLSLCVAGVCLLSTGLAQTQADTNRSFGAQRQSQVDPIGSFGALTIALRAVKFAETDLGDRPLMVLYDPEIGISKTETNLFKQRFEGTISTRGVADRTIEYVTIDELNRVGAASVVYITLGLNAYWQDVFDAVRDKSVITVAQDVDCVRSALCVIGVQPGARISIQMSERAAASTGVDFAPQFRILVDVR
jgi:hypothetical protein